MEEDREEERGWVLEFESLFFVLSFCKCSIDSFLMYIALPLQVIRPFDRVVQSRRALTTQYLFNFLSHTNLSIPPFHQKLDNLLRTHRILSTRRCVARDDVLDLLLGREGVFGVRIGFVRRSGVSNGDGGERRVVEGRRRGEEEGLNRGELDFFQRRRFPGWSRYFFSFLSFDDEKLGDTGLEVGMEVWVLQVSESQLQSTRGTRNDVRSKR